MSGVWRADSIITQTWKLPPSLAPQHSVFSLTGGLIFRAEALCLKTIERRKGCPMRWAKYTFHQSRGSKGQHGGGRAYQSTRL